MLDKMAKSLVKHDEEKTKREHNHAEGGHQPGRAYAEAGSSGMHQNVQQQRSPPDGGHAPYCNGQCGGQCSAMTQNFPQSHNARSYADQNQNANSGYDPSNNTNRYEAK